MDVLFSKENTLIWLKKEDTSVSWFRRAIQSRNELTFDKFIFYFHIKIKCIKVINISCQSQIGREMIDLSLQEPQAQLWNVKDCLFWLRWLGLAWIPH